MNLACDVPCLYRDSSAAESILGASSTMRKYMTPGLLPQVGGVLQQRQIGSGKGTRAGQVSNVSTTYQWTGELPVHFLMVARAKAERALQFAAAGLCFPYWPLMAVLANNSIRSDS